MGMKRTEKERKSKNGEFIIKSNLNWDRKEVKVCASTYTYLFLGDSTTDPSNKFKCL